MKIRKLLMGTLCMLSLGMPNTSSAQNANFNIIPQPKMVQQVPRGMFLLNQETQIYYPKKDKDMKRNAEFLAQFIHQNVGLTLQLTTQQPRHNAILLNKDTSIQNSEGYTLLVTNGLIQINGASASGVFYGIQTFRKSLPSMRDNVMTVGIPHVKIEDEPRFSYRGTHLDVSRHFVTPDSIRRFIDILALHNINRFHWHLTDDQGWRIEIKKYPKLTEIGAYRPETVIGHNTGKYDGIPHQGYYTQKELRDIVKYAQDRYITIIPEIDMPGHMQAALAAYPELGCTGGPYAVWKMWGISDDVLCAGNDKVLTFIDDVLDEVAEIFPSKYIHVGGDECPKTRWKDCPKCQQRIAEQKLQADKKHSAEERLQSFIINHAEKHLNQLGRQMIGWDETLEGGLAPNATVMSWRGESGGIEAARQHHDVIMTPNTYLYFDYYQTKDKENEPEAIGGYLPIETVYSYEPMPKSLNPEEQKFIIGIQANIWTEYMPTFRQIEYMALPRLAALSEVQWSLPNMKNYTSFTKRIPRLTSLYKKLGYNFAKHVFDVKSQISTNPEKRAINVKLSTIDNADIRYTTDGTTPHARSPRYKDPIDIQKSCTFKAAAFRGEEMTHVLQEDFTFNKATVCAIDMLQPINNMYKFAGAPALVDGLRGNDTNYQTGRWIGFYQGDLEAVIDLGKDTEISKVGFNTCVEKGAWIFDTRGVEISLSNDGINFTQVVKKDFPAMTAENPNRIYHHNFSFTPTQTRYVKVKALSERNLPAWHGGKGRPAFLFVDEIVVE